MYIWGLLSLEDWILPILIPLLFGTGRDLWIIDWIDNTDILEEFGNMKHFKFLNFGNVLEKIGKIHKKVHRDISFLRVEWILQKFINWLDFGY